jgi:hypothetical protein
MAYKNIPLDDVKVATPCPASWDEMTGNDRVRFCGQCNLNVYNLSGMRRVEAERLVASTEGRLCVRYYRRKDGTILTKDCPVGLAALRRRISRAASAVAGLVFGLVGGTAAGLAYRAFEPAPDKYDGYVAGSMVAPTVQPPEVMGNVVTMGAPMREEVGERVQIQPRRRTKGK